MCEDQVLPLAINIMDRFLCVCCIKRQQLQLLGATCLLIASKLRSTNLLPIDLLCAYTDYSVTTIHIMVSLHDTLLNSACIFNNCKILFNEENMLYS
nr:unnamed protein product [Callosobruchus analis]